MHGKWSTDSCGASIGLMPLSCRSALPLGWCCENPLKWPLQCQLAVAETEGEMANEKRNLVMGVQEFRWVTQFAMSKVLLCVYRSRSFRDG